MRIRNMITAVLMLLSTHAIKAQSDSLKLFQEGKDLLLEIPRSMMERRFVVTTRLNECSDPVVTLGASLSSNPVMRFTMVDTSLVLTSPGKEVLVLDNDSNIASALSAGKREQVRFVIPVKKWNEDSTALIVKADKLVTGDDVLDLKKISFSGGSIESFSMEGTASVQECGSTGDRTYIRREANWKLNGKKNLFFTGTYTTSITLLDENEFTLKKADSRVGTLSVKYSSYKSTGGTRSDSYVSRYDLSGDKKLIYYVDTLLSPSWRKAVSEGILEWNKAFVQAGMGARIEVRELTSDVDLNDPRVSAVTYRGTQSMNVTGSVINDERGKILSSNIRIPGDFRSYVRRCSAFTMSDVDSRYARFDIPDDAVCEVLKATVMQYAGLCLGLTVNKAGSYAFSPSELSSPEFTREHGITASVLDEVLFNFFADKGDVERGLVTVVDRIGEYDKYAIGWLYADKPVNPAMLYLPAQSFAFDPRSMSIASAYVAGTVDLGNDILASYDAISRHVNNISGICMEWINADGIPGSYSELFADWLFLAKYNCLVQMAKYAGAMYVNDVRSGDTRPRLEPVDAQLQKECMKRFFSALDEFDYIGKDVLHVAGANKNLDYMVHSNVMSMMMFTVRMAAVAMSEQVTGNAYGVDDYMTDVQNGVLSNVKRGILKDGEILKIQQYISQLCTYAPLLKSNMNRGLKPSNLADNASAGDIALAMPDGVPMTYLDGMDAVAYRYLKSVKADLKKGRARAKDDFTKREIDFLILMVDSALSGTE